MPVGFANRASCTGGMGFEAGNGQPAPPARRVRVGWCPSRCVPASASVISPPPRGEGASGTPWAHFEWGTGEIGDHGQVRNAAATASRLNWSRLELPTPLSLTHGKEPTDPPPLTRHAERRKLREARLLRAFLGQLFAKFGNPENVWVCGEEKRVPVHILVSGRVKKSAPPRTQNVERGVLCHP